MPDGLRERLLSRYWRRRYRAAADKAALLGVLRRRQAERASLAAPAVAALSSSEPGA